MKRHASVVILAFLSGVFSPLIGHAATVWTGPPITKANTDGVDQITPNVGITRGGSAGIYNASQEAGFTHFLSPKDTEWADGTTATYTNLSYTDWNSWAKFDHGGPPSTVGVNAVVHLISDDIYIDITFLSWSVGGPYSYQRSTAPQPNQPPIVAIDSPTNGASFTTPAIVTIDATASDDGSVTNVAFFDGATFLGQTNNTPYGVTANLAAGSHPLTAVATDNLGLSATSSVVNVTVNVGNSPPSVTITNPADNAVFGNTDSVAIRGSAVDSDGTVTNVQVFNGAVLLRTFTSGAFSFNATGIAGNLALGTNTLVAVATDNLGARATSGPVHVVVSRYLPPITNGTIAILLQPVATGLAAPDYAISPPGDTHRLFVLEQNGLIRVIQDGALLPTPALDIQTRVAPPLVPTSP
ncbi:MAG TPA: Ig-like domain-containing protein, partial [Candidatus Dormibacteraeota bacterium]|nr:Ig-like domain-containing protein [Candidatus Dormibacteraeota bacterium]